jgi:hypothetical protein
MREPGDDGPFSRLKKKVKRNPWPEQPPRRAGGVAALELRARLHLATNPSPSGSKFFGFTFIWFLFWNHANTFTPHP